MRLNGRMRVPSDKSISHRAVLFAGLAEGVSHLSCVLPSADVLASIDAVKALGAEVDVTPGPSGLDMDVDGIGLHPRAQTPVKIYCGNSGTTARLLMGISAGMGIEVELTGDASLSARPMERVMKPLSLMGASFESDDGHLPVDVKASGPLHCADITTEQASAQVKSAVLLAGMQTCGTTSVTEPSKSRDHTELLLPAFGVEVETCGLTSKVTGPCRMHHHDMVVPGDPSSAAFLAVAAALVPHSSVTLECVSLNPTRTGAFDMLERMGANIAFENGRLEGSEPVGDVVVHASDGLTSTEVEPAQIPSLIDEIPVLSLAAAMAHGETVFRGASELRVKECDRMEAIVEGLAAFGVDAHADGEDLHVIGVSGDTSGMPSEVRLSTRHDHRLAMAWSIAGIVFGVDVVLDDIDCVKVSWPGFFDDIRGIVL